MRKLRRKKKGYVYLLKSDKTINGKCVYKYGCTTLTPEKRCSVINSQNKKYGIFSVLFYIESTDIFKKECEIKWKLWSIFAVEEFFICSDDELNYLVKPFFEV